MRHRPRRSAKLRIRSLSELLLPEFEEWMSRHDLPKYRARQIFQWVYQRGAREYTGMTDLPKDLRDRVAAEIPILSSRIHRHQVSSDGTLKLLLSLSDGEAIETVMIPEEPRRTVCLSTQVGCAMGCAFCASGLSGLKRHLTAGEIVEQVLHVHQAMETQERVSHIVFMGMGEPLANYRNLDRAIQILHADWGFGIGKRHMTVSTVGLLSHTKALARDHPQVTLAVSLHAPNDEVRRQLLPYARKVSIQDLIAGAHAYFEATGRRLTFEYCLIGDVNDRPQHAVELADRLRGLNGYVNLIPWNPVAGIPLKAASEDSVREFAEVLRKSGVEVAIRRRRGTDIDAACGQLRMQAQAESPPDVTPPQPSSPEPTP